MRKGQQIQRVSRQIDVNNHTLTIEEHTELENEAGAVVWDAALVLLNYFCTDPGLLQGKRCIELGAGTGVVGLTAALLGALVVLTDLPIYLSGLERNVQVNSLQSFVSVRELQWGTDTDSFGPPFDVIIASDLLYDMRSIPDLMLTIVSLSSSDTVTYLAFEVRPHVIRAAFQAMEAYGLKAEEVTQSQLHPDWQSDDIRVFKLKLPQLGL
ncbi:hypothetical protein WJX77_006801 [Trebouxia sp. C0004]